MSNFEFTHNGVKYEYDTNDMTANVEHLLNMATPTQMASGASWYYEANHYAQMIANRTGVDLFVVSLVIATVSPRNPWVFSLSQSGNLKAALDVVETFIAGGGVNDVKIQTFNRNKDKAFAILNEWQKTNPEYKYWEVEYFQNSPKTWNFANNIYNPFSSDFVTIDGHATNLALNGPVRITLENVPAMTNLRYLRLVDIYRAVAAKYNMKSWQVQAITWEVYRSLGLSGGD